MRLLFIRSFFIASVFAFLGCFIVNNAYAEEQSLDNVVAVVNADVITQSELNQQMAIAKQQLLAAGAPLPAPAVLREKVLNHLIDTALELQIAKKAHIRIDDAKVDHAIATIAARNGMTVAVLQSQLVKHGMNFAAYREEIRKEMLISEVLAKEVAPGVVVSHQDINDVKQMLKSQPLPKMPARPVTNSQYHVIDRLLPLPDNASASVVRETESQAAILRAKLQAAKNPAMVVSANNAPVQFTDMGFQRLQDLPDLFAKAVSQLQPGQFSKPLRAPNGIHILQLVAITGVPAVSAEKMSDSNNAQALAYQRKYAEAVQRFLQKLRSQSYVKIYT